MFKFKNISSDDIGVIAEEENFIKKASQKIEIIDIEGRDGSLYNELGYSNVEENFKIQILNKNYDDILNWLNGKGIFEFNDRITTAYFYTEIDLIRASSIKTADVTFVRDPFWYRKNDDYITVVDSVDNLGNVYSKPIIRIEKNQDSVVDITISDVRFQYTFNLNENYVEIDCEEMNATFDKLMRNRNLTIGFKFPILSIGSNPIIIHSGNPVIKIKRKDRWR